MKKNKINILREKLISYNKPFIDGDFLRKLLIKHSPSYAPYNLSAKWLITVIKNGKIYRNMMYKRYVSSYAILGMYMENKEYMIWWAYVYNQYGYTTQIAQWITVYNTIISWKKEIAGAKFIFRRVRPSFFWGKQKKQSQHVSYALMSAERALLQLLIETKGKPEFTDDIMHTIVQEKLSISQLLELSQKHCNKPQQAFIADFFSWKT